MGMRSSTVRWLALSVVCLWPSLVAAETEQFIRSQRLGGNITAAIAVMAPQSQSREVLKVMSKAFAEAGQIASRLDEWRRGSQTATLNATAGAQGLRVDRHMQFLLQRGIDFARMTQGGFDLMSESRRGVSYQDLTVDVQAGTVAINKKGGYLSFRWMLRGYLADRIVARLQTAGYRDYLVNVNGKLRASGRAGRSSWMVGVQDPGSPRGETVCRLPLINQALSTTAIYHPLVGRGKKSPNPNYVSVSVVAPDTVTAEVLSYTGLMMGEQAIPILQGQRGVAALFIDRSSQVRVVGSVPAACLSY